MWLSFDRCAGEFRTVQSFITLSLIIDAMHVLVSY